MLRRKLKLVLINLKWGKHVQKIHNIQSEEKQLCAEISWTISEISCLYWYYAVWRTQRFKQTAWNPPWMLCYAKWRFGQSFYGLNSFVVFGHSQFRQTNAYKRTNTFQRRNISHIDIKFAYDDCIETAHENTPKTSITKTMTRKLCFHLDFIYSLKKSSYKCTGCKENSPQEVPWSLTTLFFAVVRTVLHRTHLWSQCLS